MGGQSPDLFDTEGAEAERIASAIRSEGGSLEPAYAAVDAAIAKIEEAGYNPADVLPASAEPGIGFSLREKHNGRTLLQTIAHAWRGSLCDPQGELRKMFDHGGSIVTSSIVGAIVAALGLPIIAIPIATAVAGIILAIGLTGFCEWAAAPADESR
jgi:hypothetical protein